MRRIFCAAPKCFGTIVWPYSGSQLQHSFKTHGSNIGHSMYYHVAINIRAEVYVNYFTAVCFKDGKITVAKHVVGMQKKKNIRINDRIVHLLVLRELFTNNLSH